MAKRKHSFSHTTTHHHEDGSNTIKHHHKSDPMKDMEYAVPDHDGMMDSMQQHLSPEMNQGEEAAEAGAAGGMGAAA